MNESYLIINGKRIDLTPEQIATLGIETLKKSPYKFGVFCVNYCTDKALLEPPEATTALAAQESED